MPPQWAAASERFIHPEKKRDCGGVVARWGGEKGAPWSLRCSPTVGTGVTSVA